MNNEEDLVRVIAALVYHLGGEIVLSFDALGKPYILEFEEPGNDAQGLQLTATLEDDA